MENKKINFVKTKDLETSETLKSLGFQLIDYKDGVWTFMNNKPDYLSTFDDKKIIYSNVLTF